MLQLTWIFILKIPSVNGDGGTCSKNYGKTDMESWNPRVLSVNFGGYLPLTWQSSSRTQSTKARKTVNDLGKVRAMFAHKIIWDSESQRRRASLLVQYGRTIEEGELGWC